MKKQLLTLLGTFLFTLFSFSQDSIWIENFNYPDGTTESTTGTTWSTDDSFIQTESNLLKFATDGYGTAKN